MVHVVLAHVSLQAVRLSVGHSMESVTLQSIVLENQTNVHLIYTSLMVHLARIMKLIASKGCAQLVRIDAQKHLVKIL